VVIFVITPLLLVGIGAPMVVPEYRGGGVPVVPGAHALPVAGHDVVSVHRHP
jgi:hypothetical protein